MRFLFGVSIALSLLAFALGMFFPGNVDATCCQPEGETCAWEDDSDPASPQAEEGISPQYEFDITFDWCFADSANYTGDFTFEPTGSQNVTNVAYAPAYYFTTSCSGSKVVTVTGDLGANNLNGTLVTRGEIGAPGGPWCWQNKTVTVLKP